MTHENVVETHNLFYSAVCVFPGGGLGAVASRAKLGSESISSAVSSLGGQGAACLLLSRQVLSETN